MNTSQPKCGTGPKPKLNISKADYKVSKAPAKVGSSGPKPSPATKRSNKK